MSGQTRKGAQSSTTENKTDKDVPQGAETEVEIDDILDEIDEVLEENAEEFVRGYVQKGGQ